LTSAQETAKLEAQAFELEQKTAIAHEAKTVLESWVRYEGQVKQRQQRELAESIIAKIEKELENPKTLKQILDQSVADVESTSRRLYSIEWRVLTAFRDRLPEGSISVLQQHLWVQSVTCYIHLCNSQPHSIESTQGLGKGRNNLIVFQKRYCLTLHFPLPCYSLGPLSGSNSPRIVSAHF
jgi:hypothetical protein